MTPNLHEKFKENSVSGRYVTMYTIANKWLKKQNSTTLETIGSSVLGEPIIALQLGKGKTKILMWSQMHGNESTTTKAVLDLINFLNSDHETAADVLKSCTLCIVPILNPDGARAYTRSNANDVDLNRDAKNRTQPESIALRNLFESFKPDYCFNLHDQRTLFSVSKTDKPATVSFLSPSKDPERSIDSVRAKAMQLIVAMNMELQKYIPGQVGRYDDGFNDNCVGDQFQMQEVPTVLFEAGHFSNDYQREITRGHIFISLVKALDTIAHERVQDYEVSDYLLIPENEKRFYDILIRNAHSINTTSIDSMEVVGIRFKETLNEGCINFIPEIVEVGIQKGFYGHKILDCKIEKDYGELDRKNLLSLIQQFRG
ncbi:M14 family metallopeptidase [Muricauda sp. 2012CJ35-5]|uniref:M14 family metallopeptidase n=1 Tax=Flagellimonas spongiicola TaxID=2942208 RepID=A0ABT0PQ13_9FLAO|nr:M14 metallopeptidase family protein [Allomuricauda spongiicola]MCL6273469.1 M14 family metallopeptidase [Allomuricauda spongiicola]